LHGTVLLRRDACCQAQDVIDEPVVFHLLRLPLGCEVSLHQVASKVGNLCGACGAIPSRTPSRGPREPPPTTQMNLTRWCKRCTRSP
jgi:hypothetical protein